MQTSTFARVPATVKRVGRENGTSRKRLLQVLQPVQVVHTELLAATSLRSPQHRDAGGKDASTAYARTTRGLSYLITVFSHANNLIQAEWALCANAGNLRN